MQGFEICRRYNLTTQAIPENDIERMETLLWQWRERWKANYDDKRERAGNEVFNMNGDHALGDLWDWEKFAEDNYQEATAQYPSIVLIPILLLLCVR